MVTMWVLVVLAGASTGGITEVPFVSGDQCMRAADQINADRRQYNSVPTAYCFRRKDQP